MYYFWIFSSESRLFTITLEMSLSQGAIALPYHSTMNLRNLIAFSFVSWSAFLNNQIRTSNCEGEEKGESNSKKRE